MSKFIVDLYLDGYETEKEMEDACEEFIYDQLNFTASSVKIERIKDPASDRLDPTNEASEISPTREHLEDPYVLQLIRALSMQQDEISDLRDEIECLQERYDLAVKKNGEQFYKIERLEIENAKLNNYMQRVKDAVKSFEALDNETSGAALPWECPRCGKIDWPTGDGTGSQCSACRHEEQ